MALGAILGGELTGDERPGQYDMNTGMVAAASVSRRWGFGDGPWFATGSATVAAGTTTTEGASESERLTAFDVRVGVIAGRRFADVVSPYVLARAFGGPVLWTVAGEDISGSDTHHYQLGAGVSVITEMGLSVVVDVSLLGERSAALALSWRR